MADDNAKPAKPPQPYWLIYVAVLLAGLLMLAHALNYHPAQKISARLAVALIYSALALFVGNGRPAGFVATGIIWVATILLFVI